VAPLKAVAPVEPSDATAALAKTATSTTAIAVAAKAETPRAAPKKPSIVKAVARVVPIDAPKPAEVVRPVAQLRSVPQPAKPATTGAAAAKPAAPPRAPTPLPKASTAAPAAKPAEPAAVAAPAATPARGIPMPDFEALSRNVARLIDEGSKAAAAYLKPREGASPGRAGDDAADAVNTFGKVAEYYYASPQRAFAAQAALANQFMALLSSTMHRLSGDAPPEPAPEPVDKRFADPEWSANPYFDFIRRAHAVTSRWAETMVHEAQGVEPHVRAKAEFYVKQLSSALSPSNFVATNPELLRATLAENGENLVRGMHMMAEDIAAGQGDLRIRQTDASKFELGRDLATTPGKVVLRNDLIELIQYAPTTPSVHKRPLLIVPPWINKFYILDLNPEKSFVRWAVAQGLTVFIVSWVNPDERHAKKDFDAYMREGIFAALDAVEAATGERDVATIGYCVGGTLLAGTLAYMAATGDKRVSSATFFTTQVDFTDPGDLKIFVDEEQLRSLEARMKEKGFLDGSKMANAFNMLRPNDLIWTYFVNNYLKGREPMPFDLLVWNSDSTRMPAANHSFYLRNCYLENNLTKGRMMLGGRKVDLKDIKIPIYDLAAREDHIAPARSVFAGARFFGGPVRYVMSGSGHIAGVVNPPAKVKYQYWSGPPVGADFDQWLKAAKETPGSWWPDWYAWLKAQSPEMVDARIPGAGALKAIEDAPGTYVRARS
jgi:polyhydroxyalkanoate synthase